MIRIHAFDYQVNSRFAADAGAFPTNGLPLLSDVRPTTVGAKMTRAFVAVPASATAEAAIGIVRAKAFESAEAGRELFLSVIYALDAEGRLLGAATLQTVLAAAPRTPIAELLMPPAVVLDPADEDDLAAQTLEASGLDAVAVADERGRLAGVVTAEAALEIGREDAAGRLARFGGSGAAAGSDDLDYLRSSIKRILSVRLLWLVLLTLFGMATSSFVAAQEALLEKAIILAAFIAPIVDMGGNVGSQSATLVIRSMTLGDVSARWPDFWAIMKRELPVAAALGVLIAALEGALAYFGKGLPADVLAVVVLSMMLCTMLGGIAGAALPFAAKRLGADPATLSSPLITSIMDLLGVAVYFGLAVLILSPERFAG